MSVTGREKIDDRDAYVVEAQPLGEQASPAAPVRRVEKLFFDIQSGLLLRRTVLTSTAFGLDPGSYLGKPILGIEHRIRSARTMRNLFPLCSLRLASRKTWHEDWYASAEPLSKERGRGERERGDKI